MIRRVDVPPQRIFASIPLQLPLIRMSAAEAIKMQGEPQIYDNPYPLDYDGLGLDPAWYSNTGMGDLGIWGTIKKVIQQRPPKPPRPPHAGPNYSPGYNAPARPPRQKTGETRQDLDGLYGLGNVSFGNVAMLPHEVAQMAGGLGYLGLTAAQKAAQEKRAAAQRAAADKRAAAQKAATDKRAAAQQAATDKRAAAKTTADQRRTDGKTAADQRKADAKTAADQRKADAALKQSCVKSGGLWDAVKKVCGTKPVSSAQSAKLQRDCKKAGGTWDGSKCISAQDQCATQGGYWNGSACVPKAQQDCIGQGGTWDAATGVCVTASILAQQQCAATGGNWVNGACQAPGQGDLSAQIAACAAQKGFWNGSSCEQVAPLPQQCPVGYAVDATGQCVSISNPIPPPPPSPWGGGGSIAPIPPGFDSGGGGMPMGPGPGMQTGLMPDQGNQYAPSVEEEQPADEAQTDEETKDKAEDDSSAVAGTNIFESFFKTLGIAGVTSGLASPPPWIGMGGTNLGPQYSVAPQSQTIKPSTTSGVVITGLALVAISALIFVWSKGKK